MLLTFSSQKEEPFCDCAIEALARDVKARFSSVRPAKPYLLLSFFISSLGGDLCFVNIFLSDAVKFTAVYANWHCVDIERITFSKTAASCY